MANKNNIDQKAAEEAKAAAEAKAAEEATAEATAEANTTPESKDIVFEIDGVKYKFTEYFTGKLQYNNKAYTTKQLLNSKDVLEALVVGNSPFVTTV